MISFCLDQVSLSDKELFHRPSQK